MKTTICITLLAALSASANLQAASFNGAYSQNFDSLGSGTTNLAGWTSCPISGGHDTFAPADSSHPGDSGLPDGSEINAGSPSSNLYAYSPSNQKSSSRAYNWDVDGNGNRSLGSSPTSIAGMVLQLSLTNDSAQPVNALSIGYDILRFSACGNNNGYSTSPYYGKEELPGYRLFISLDNGATYSNITSLNPDAYTWPNTTGSSAMSDDNIALDSAWNPGATLLLRWFDDNAQSGSPDQLIGLDNLVISAVPEPASLALLALGAISLINRKRRQ